VKFVAGQLIVVTGGEYSDFAIHGYAKALKDFDTDDLKLKRIRSMHTFIARGFIEELEPDQIVELYLGC
jgi:hypothetical protein